MPPEKLINSSTTTKKNHGYHQPLGGLHRAKVQASGSLSDGT